MHEPVRVGMIGCGAISGYYLKNAPDYPAFRIISCADLDISRAQALADQFQIPRVYSPAEMLTDPEVETILNLTIPAAHAQIALETIAGGKSVYGEKPLAVRFSEGSEIVAAARQQGVRLGSAPDTFLGASHQNARRLIDEGAIGVPLAVTAFMLSPGVERWHPNPEFYYKPGGGPMFDMGPYYLTALVNLLGPVQRVSGSARISRPQRVITSQPASGGIINVEVPTHVAALLEFHSGVIGTLITSFDVQAHSLPHFEVYGSEATLMIPDPNRFDGDVKIRRVGQTEWETATGGNFRENSRGVGLADMAVAMRSGGEHRASGDLALHVLEIMEAVHVAAEEGRHVKITTSVERPEPL